uniref:peptidogalycan biosysnthesis protein n=1 Tax=Yoonia sp. TaxID=2212373 RepID=UPI00404734BE
MTQSPIEISTHPTIADIGQTEWDACACPEDASGRPADPFTTYRFLHAREQSGSVGGRSGWQPRYLRATQDG